MPYNGIINGGGVLPPSNLPDDDTVRGASTRASTLRNKNLKGKSLKGSNLKSSGKSQVHTPSRTSSASAPSLSRPLLTVADSSKEGGTKNNTSSRLYVGMPHLDKPTMDSQILTAIFNHLRNELGDKQMESQKKELKSSDKSLQEQHKKVIAKIKDSIKKTEKSKKASLVSKIFGWIGTVVAVIAAVVATIATGGAAWPMLAMAVVGLGLMIMSETGAMTKMMTGIAKGFAKMLEAFGTSADKAKEISQYMAMAVVMTVIIGANIIAAVASGGATASETAAMVLQVSRLIETVVQATSMVSEGGADVAKAVYTSDATKDRADEAETHATIKEMESNKQQMVTDIKRTSKMIQDTRSSAFEVIQSFNEGTDYTAEQMV